MFQGQSEENAQEFEQLRIELPPPAVARTSTVEEVLLLLSRPAWLCGFVLWAVAASTRTVTRTTLSCTALSANKAVLVTQLVSTTVGVATYVPVLLPTMENAAVDAGF
jgi:hypothetical protein